MKFYFAKVMEIMWKILPTVGFISLGKFPANSNLYTKLTPSKSSGKSSSELFVLAPDWSEFERKCVWLQANRVELTGFCTVKALKYKNYSKQIEWDLAGSLKQYPLNSTQFAWSQLMNLTGQLETIKDILICIALQNAYWNCFWGILEILMNHLICITKFISLHH